MVNHLNDRQSILTANFFQKKHYGIPTSNQKKFNELNSLNFLTNLNALFIKQKKIITCPSNYIAIVTENTGPFPFWLSIVMSLILSDDYFE